MQFPLEPPSKGTTRGTKTKPLDDGRKSAKDADIQSRLQDLDHGGACTRGRRKMLRNNHKDKGREQLESVCVRAWYSKIVSCVTKKQQLMIPLEHRRHVKVLQDRTLAHVRCVQTLVLVLGMKCQLLLNL